MYFQPGGPDAADRIDVHRAVAAVGGEDAVAMRGRLAAEHGEERAAVDRPVGRPSPPAASSSVGRRSTQLTIASVRVPGFTTPGQATISGTRMPAS